MKVKLKSEHPGHFVMVYVGENAFNFDKSWAIVDDRLYDVLSKDRWLEFADLPVAPQPVVSAPVISDEVKPIKAVKK